MMTKKRNHTALNFFPPITTLAAVLIFVPDLCLTSPNTYDATVMTYNVWNYGGTSAADNAREDHLATVIHSVAPDILVAQEIKNTAGYTHLLEDVLNEEDPGRYEGAPFSNQSGTDLDIALFYDPGVFQFVSTQVIDLTSKSGQRDGVEFVLEHLPTGTELTVYGIHLKSSIGPDNETERESEASNLRVYLNDLDLNTSFLVAGDFNVYHSDEGAFQRLTESQDDNDGRLFDPLDRLGHWHNNSGFADIHTQSSRGDFGGKWYGGLDDRFDFILVSSAIMDTNSVNVVPGSYTAFGNDGNHFNLAVNDEPPNTAVSADMADALVEASDHLPVYLKLRILGAEPSPFQVVINEIMKNPRVTSDGLGEWFELYNADPASINLCGWTVFDWRTDYFQVECTEDSLWMSPGGYLVLGNNGNLATNGGAPVDYEYRPDPTFRLNNGADQILLFDSQGGEVDRVEYDDGGEFPSPEGASMALLDVTADNNLRANWTVSTQPYGDGDLGTPGESNHEEEPSVARDYHLFQNFPNPFNASTTLSFNLPHSAPVTLVILDLRGHQVVTLARGWTEGGRHEVIWNSVHNPSGIYICRLEAGTFRESRKLVLIK